VVTARAICKAPVKSSPPTNQYSPFYRPDALPVAQLTVSEQCIFLSICLSLSLSLFILTAIFPGTPGLTGYIGAKDEGSNGDNWSYETCLKLQSNHHHQHTNTQAGCPSCRPTNSVRALKGMRIEKRN